MSESALTRILASLTVLALLAPSAPTQSDCCRDAAGARPTGTAKTDCCASPAGEPVNDRCPEADHELGAEAPRVAHEGFEVAVCSAACARSRRKLWS